MTLLADLRHDRIVGPWLIEGPIDGESFRTYVEKVLVPTLYELNIVIMDIGSHKGKAVRALIRSAGAKLFFLPKFSLRPEPDRTALGQAQTPLAKSRRANRRSDLRRVW
jgi:hypothetical protein